MRKLQKERMRNPLLKGFINPKNGPKRPRKLEKIQREVQKRGDVLGMTKWWDGVVGREIFCLSAMKGEPPKLEVNFRGSSVHWIQ